MRTLVGVPDKILAKWLEDKEYISASDEGEAIAIGAGYYLATKKRATVFFSADGFMNALSPLTSWIIPEGIKMNIVISIGRQEPPHIIATQITKKIIKLLNANTERISFRFIEKK